MALANHGAPQAHQQGGAEAELLRAQERGDDHIAAGFELSIRLEPNPVAHIVDHKSLVRFGQPQFPGQSRMADAGERRGTGAAIVAGNQDGIRTGLGHPCAHRSHAHFRSQFDRNTGPGINLPQVIDKLGKILN